MQNAIITDVEWYEMVNLFMQKISDKNAIQNFYVLEDVAFKNVKHINPIKQRQINEMLKVVSEYNDLVECIIVFGSSIRYDCTFKSDIDLLVKWKDGTYDWQTGVTDRSRSDLCQELLKISGYNIDIVDVDRHNLDDDIIKVARKGVVVYGNNDF